MKTCAHLLIHFVSHEVTRWLLRLFTHAITHICVINCRSDKRESKKLNSMSQEGEDKKEYLDFNQHVSFTPTWNHNNNFNIKNTFNNHKDIYTSHKDNNNTCIDPYNNNKSNDDTLLPSRQAQKDNQEMPAYSVIDRSRLTSLQLGNQLNQGPSHICYHFNSDSKPPTITTPHSILIPPEKPNGKKSSVKAYLKVTWSKKFYPNEKKTSHAFIPSSLPHSTPPFIPSPLPHPSPAIHPCPLHSNKPHHFSFEN